VGTRRHSRSDYPRSVKMAGANGRSVLTKFVTESPCPPPGSHPRSRAVPGKGAECTRPLF
jgi:hypothetical protein